MVSRVPVLMHMLVMLCCLSEFAVSHISARNAEHRARARAQLQDHDRDQARARPFSDKSKGWFQIGEGLARAPAPNPSPGPGPMGFIPLRSKYSRAGLQFLRRLPSLPVSGKHHMRAFHKPPIIVDTGSDENRAFQGQS